MKREIKFRITYQHEDTGRITQRIIELGQPIPHLGERWFVIGQDQFTGLKDKNWKEIYEGDIVNCTPGCPHEIVFVKEMGGMFTGGMPGFNLSGLSMSGGRGYAWTGTEEVIGNIYENPELLKITER